MARPNRQTMYVLAAVSAIMLAPAIVFLLRHSAADLEHPWESQDARVSMVAADVKTTPAPRRHPSAPWPPTHPHPSAASTAASIARAPHGTAANGDDDDGDDGEKPERTPTAALRLGLPSVEVGDGGGYLFLRVPANYYVGNFTMEFWYRWAGSAVAPSKRLALISNERSSHDNANYNGRHVGLYVEPSGELTLECTSHTGQTWSVHGGADSRPTDGAWHHYAVVRDKSRQQLELWVDGALVGASELPNGIDIEAQDQPTIVGGGNDGTIAPGELDDVRFWTVARSAAAVRTAAAAPTGCVAAGAVAVKDVRARADGYQSDSAAGGRTRDGLLVWYRFNGAGAVADSDARGTSRSARPRTVLDVAGSRTYGVLMGRNVTIGPAGRARAAGVCGDPYAASAQQWAAEAAAPDRAAVPHPEGVVLTCLLTQEDNRANYGPVEDDNNFFQIDHYVSGLFTDATRVGVRVIVLYDKLSDEFVERYASPFIELVPVGPLNVVLNPPRLVNDARYYYYDKFLRLPGRGAQAQPTAWAYVAAVDLRDTRLNFDPFGLLAAATGATGTSATSGGVAGAAAASGGAGPASTAPGQPRRLAWIQTVVHPPHADQFRACGMPEPPAMPDNYNPLYCAGVVAGTLQAFEAMLALTIRGLNMSPAAADCNMNAVNWAVRMLPRDGPAAVAVRDGFPFVNRQHDRALSGEHAIYHGSWWNDRSGGGRLRDASRIP